MSRRLQARRALAMVLIASIGVAVVAAGPASDPPAPDTRLQMIVDYGDGVQKHFTALPWHEGWTVLDALEAAQKHPRGIKFAYRGKGATAFLTRIDDLDNEGRGRNWVYQVNGQLADCSFASFVLKAGDTVLWKFSEPR